MSWPRWFAAVALATLGALIVSVSVGDFDAGRQAARHQAAIEQARSISGVDPSGSRP
jgi:hypothetical protein